MSYRIGTIDELLCSVSEGAGDDNRLHSVKIESRSVEGSRASARFAYVFLDAHERKSSTDLGVTDIPVPDGMEFEAMLAAVVDEAKKRTNDGEDR